MWRAIVFLAVVFSNTVLASENQFGVICLEEKRRLPACVEDIEVEFNLGVTPWAREFPSDYFLREDAVRCFLSGGGPGGCGTGSG